ncbi:unannotated protein [freshwater metagenome]|uniref:Unannotated protein n=1 Tax=freshwater metagenome TaxID=449393 RepID=A0A6J7JI06_9ZZZZ
MEERGNRLDFVASLNGRFAEPQFVECANRKFVEQARRHERRGAHEFTSVVLVWIGTDLWCCFFCASESTAREHRATHVGTGRHEINPGHRVVVEVIAGAHELTHGVEIGSAVGVDDELA